MENWSFEDQHGNILTAGWRGTREQARALAQRLANERWEVIGFWSDAEETHNPYAFPVPGSEVVKPRGA